MYRSFLTCHDPKGVVKGGTIRKYRTCSHKMKDMIKIQKANENLVEASLMNKRYKKEVTKGSNLQLTQVVSRGDQSYNMVDSWSRDLVYDGKSEDIAKGILRGALDLQDSLTMLHKLQEASQHATPFRRKQTERSKRNRFDTKMIGRMKANPFSEQRNPKGFQTPQPCDGCSSSNCKEELKRVIKERLVRQNLFPRPSQSSSGVGTVKVSDNSLSVIASKMERGPNLVVKLMGLEEAPSSSSSAFKQKQLNVDMSKVRKNDSMDAKVNPELNTLRETLDVDTMHFKGLLNKSFVKDPKLKLLQVHHSNDPNSKQVDDLSHIALKKPPFLLHQESVKTHKSNPPEELSIRKLKAEIISSKMIKNRKGSTSINMGKELERDASKLLNKVEGPKFMKGVVKLDVKGINYIEASSGKVELHCHIGHTSHVNETVDKKWKVHTVSRKQPENDVSEPRIVTRPQYQQEITTAKFSKPKRGSRIDKNEISCLKSTGSNNNSIYKAELQKANNSKDLNIEIKKIDSMVDSLTHRKNQMKNTSPAAEHEPAKLTVEQMRQGEEKKSIDVLGKEDYTEIRVATTLEDELLMVCEVDTCTYKNGDCMPSKICSGSDHIMLLKSEQENDSILAEEAHENNSSKVDSITHDTEGAKLKHFLLTSQTFIGHAEKLFNLDVDCPKNLQKGETNHGIANLRLYLDCANELMDLKSLQESQVVGSFLLNCVGNSRLRISLGRLVGEIYDAIENLKFYNEDSEEKRFAGNVFDMMEKDMRCNGVVNSVWERGWKHGFSADEVEQVVNEIESMLISGLIEETIL